MKIKKAVSIMLLAAFAASAVSSCGTKKENDESGEELSVKINVDGNDVRVIDDMKDWDGEQKNLVYWFCNGGSPYIGKKSSDDTIRKELTRVSGIAWDDKNSFDNNNQGQDTIISKIIASNTWPDIACYLDKNLIDKLAENDKIWDLTEYIPKYMDNYMKIVNADETTKKEFENLKSDGKIWSWVQTSPGAAKYLNSEYKEKDYENLVIGEETRQWIWVRDDILTTLYPNAKTLDDIKRIYVDKGSFTKEDMTDVTITSLDEFRSFLEKINNLNLTENGRKVWPFYTHDGGDNWNLLTCFGGIVGSPNIMSNYFAYFDNTEKKLVRTPDKDWFKELCKFYVDLINDGIASKEALVDNKSAFEQKKNNGEYAVLYGNDQPPTEDQLKAAGKSFQYRKVLIDVPINHDRYIKQNQEAEIFNGTTWTIFKTDRIKTEKDLEQLLRYIDFFYSEAGQKCAFWGPEKAGLYTEENNSLKYTDKDLEGNMVYDTGIDAMVAHGFNSWPPIVSDFRPETSKYNPKVVYTKRGDARTPDQYTNAWRYSAVEKLQNYPQLKVDCNLWNWIPYVDDLKGFWDARTASEDAIKMMFTAQNDAEFEKYYQEVKNTYERNGLTQEVMDKWNKTFDEVNADYIEAFKNWKPEAR